MQDNYVYLINQQLLPHKFEIYQSKNHIDTANAIKTMIVRGAGAIGAAGAYGVAQAVLEADKDNFSQYIENAVLSLKNTRPTAQNLFAGIDFVYDAIKNAANNIQNKDNLIFAKNLLEKILKVRKEKVCHIVFRI